MAGPREAKEHDGRHDSVSYAKQSHRSYQDRSTDKHAYRERSRSPALFGRSSSRQDRTDRPAEALHRPESHAPPALHSIQRARVVSIRPVGLFVRLQGFSKDALVHNSQVSADVTFSRDDDDADKVKALEYFAPVSSDVWVLVTDIRGDGKISCSMRAVSQETGELLGDLDSLAGQTMRSSGDPPSVGSIHHATVASIKPYGVFVRLDGFRANGLVHASQVSDHLDLRQEETDEDKVVALATIVSVGDKVYVKVVEVEDDPQGRGTRIKCSLKGVGPDGHDTDPSMSLYVPRPPQSGARRGPIGSQAAEAQGGRIEWGHLAAADKQFGDFAKSYALLGDEVLDIPAPPPPGPSGNANGHLMQSSDPARAAPDSTGQIASVEEAMAILRKHKKGSKHKKEKKSKGSDKHKKQKTTRKEKHA